MNETRKGNTNQKQNDDENKKLITKKTIEQENDDNDKKSTINNPTMNPMAIDNPILNEESLHKINPTQRSHALSTNTKNIAQSILYNLSFRKHVRLSGSIILFMLLIIATTHLVYNELNKIILKMSSYYTNIMSIIKTRKSKSRTHGTRTNNYNFRHN